MGKKVYSKCGNRCDLCLVYRPNVEQEDRREEICAVWSKVWDGYNLDPQTVICNGCSSEDKDAVLFSTMCETRVSVCRNWCKPCWYISRC